MLVDRAEKLVRWLLSMPEKHIGRLELTRPKENRSCVDDTCLEPWGEAEQGYRFEVGFRVVYSESRSVTAWTGGQNNRKF
jgi:hypothetical protein